MSIDLNCDLNSPPPNEPFFLREWSPQTNLLSKIPLKALRGLMTLDLHLTCISSLSDYLVIGTNVGIIYWYNRKNGLLERLKLEGNTSPITSICAVSCEFYMVAAGNKEGTICIFQIPKSRLIDPDDDIQNLNHVPNSPSNSDHERKKAQIFTVRNVHRALITALEWSANGMKLFSGDLSGMVVETEIDVFSGISKSSNLFEETHEIIQLSYLNFKLLTSTTFRTIIYCTRTKEMTQVGSKDRSIHGAFGGIFEPGIWSKNHKAYVSRPNLRIWVVSQDGSVLQTLKLKDAFQLPCNPIPVIKPFLKSTKSTQEQLGILYNYMGKYLATCYQNKLYIIDPMKLSVIASCHEISSISSISVHKDEIFLLEGSRNIIRIAPKPDSHYLFETKNSSPSLLSDFKFPEQPFNFISSKFKEVRPSLPKLNSSLLNTVRNILEADVNIQNGEFIVLPNVIPLSDKDKITPVLVGDEPKTISTDELKKIEAKNGEELSKFDQISGESYQNALLVEYRPESRTKKKNKHGKYSDSLSMSSQYSSTSEGDSPEKERSTETSASSSYNSNPNTNSPLNKSSSSFIQSADLKSKEEMLAKLLNWTEFLETQNENISDENIENKTESTKTLSPQKESIYEPELSLQLEEIPKNFTPKEFNVSSYYEEDSDYASTDIYNSNKNESDSLTSESTLCFGPPSGSSNVNSLETIINNPVHNFELSQDLSVIQERIVSPVGDMEVDGVTLPDNWIQFKLPSSPKLISLSSNFLFCIDAKYRVYITRIDISNEYRWIKTEIFASQISCSVLAQLIWKLDPSGTLYSSSESIEEFYNNLFSENLSSSWEVIAENVKSFCLNNDRGIIIKNDGNLLVSKLSPQLSIPSFEKLAVPWTPLKIEILDHSIWALSTDGKLAYRSGVGSRSYFGDLWNELFLEFPVSNFTLSSSIIWLTDSLNQLYLIRGISRRAPGGDSHLWTVDLSLLSFELFTSEPQSLQNYNLMRQLTQKLSDTFLYPSFLGKNTARIPLLCASNSSIFLCIQGGSFVYQNTSSLLGHRWERILVETSAKSYKWTNVSAESVYNDYGFIWLTAQGGRLFYLKAGKNTAKPLDLPCSDVAQIAAAPQALWVLNSFGKIFARCNISAQDELGNGWDEIQVSPLDSGSKLTYISCGSEVVWACDNHGKIYLRSGSLSPPSSTDFSPVWLEVEGSPEGSDTFFTQVEVGANDRIVWAIDNLGNCYAREAVFSDYHIGTGWVLCPSIEATMLTISESGVWALNNKGEIFQRTGISSNNFIGNSWRKVPGEAKSISASVSNEIWATDAVCNVKKHSMETVRFSRALTRESSYCSEDEENSDWVVLEQSTQHENEVMSS